MEGGAPRGWGYSQYCEHYRRWLATTDVVMRLSYAAGERMFVDFSGDKAIWCDPDTGEIHEADVFVAILGYSGLLYVEATRAQGPRQLGGCPRRRLEVLRWCQ